ncbi:unnamed protein product, partial [Ectocarpus sp. 8 AP-2014]
MDQTCTHHRAGATKSPLPPVIFLFAPKILAASLMDLLTGFSQHLQPLLQRYKQPNVTVLQEAGCLFAESFAQFSTTQEVFLPCLVGQNTGREYSSRTSMMPPF